MSSLGSNQKIVILCRNRCDKRQFLDPFGMLKGISGQEFDGYFFAYADHAFQIFLGSHCDYAAFVHDADTRTDLLDFFHIM